MIAGSITLDGKRYVLIPHDEYVGLRTAAQLPPLPEPDADGNYPAREYMLATIARDIILDRIRLGLTQRELARRAGLRVETLCRIESGKVTPTIGSIDKIDRAIKQVEAERAKPSRGGAQSGRATKRRPPRKAKSRGVKSR